MILMFISGVNGDSKIEGFAPDSKSNGIALESFSFGVERELAESGKAGTSDINIGVGELQECSVSKSMDNASFYLARKAISGSSVGTVEIKFIEAITKGEENKNICYLHYKLDNAFIKSWSTSGDADDRPTEDVTLWYNKIAFVYFTTKDGKEFEFSGECAWDQVTSKPWAEANMEKQAEEH